MSLIISEILAVCSSVMRSASIKITGKSSDDERVVILSINLLYPAFLLCISLFHAWRYSKVSIDPDWSYFNLYAFTGSLYGRDFADCKTPGVHIYYWLLSKLVGVNIRRIKFANHFLVGSVGVVLYLMTGNFWSALAYTVLINSGWLLAFHGNVGQVPAALIAIAMAANPFVSSVLWLAAVFYEPKLAPSFVVYAVLSGWLIGILLSIPVGLLGYFFFKNTQWFKWLWESSVTIPARMGKNRNFETWLPWFTANPLLYVLPWIGLGIYFKPDFFYWLPALAYFVFICLGRAIRPNHLIPIIPWLLGLPPVFVIGLVLIDFISSGFYLGDIWLRYYPALANINDDARAAGEWLRDKAGTLYVNSIHSGMYIYAGKPIPLGMGEQIEIREVATERREEMKRLWRETPPDWVVCGDVPGINFKPIGYSRVAVAGANVIYRKGG